MDYHYCCNSLVNDSHENGARKKSDISKWIGMGGTIENELKSERTILFSHT